MSCCKEMCHRCDNTLCLHRVEDKPERDRNLKKMCRYGFIPKEPPVPPKLNGPRYCDGWEETWLWKFIHRNV
jgi:hypothetical protein